LAIILNLVLNLKQKPLKLAKKGALMLEVRIFRFDAKYDVLRYYKPYFFDESDFKTPEILLNEVKKQDPFFEYGKSSHIKINGVVVPIDWDFEDILRRFGDKLTIEPLSTKRAVKDLAIDDGDFWDKIKPFAKFCDTSDKAAYAQLEPYFYADFIKDYESGFVGASAIMLAKILCEKYPQKKDEILQLVADKKTGVWIARNLSDFIIDGSEIYDTAVEFASLNLKQPKCERKALAPEPDTGKILDMRHDFNGFKIAFTGEISSELKKLKAKFIKPQSANLPCGFDMLGLNYELAYKLASKILFEAFDSGADFLLALNEAQFYMFDTLSAKLSKFCGRDLDEFYILRQSELIALANGDTPQSLSEHRLKVGLVL